MPNAFDFDNLLPTQTACLKAVLSRQHKRIIWVGAVRSGKGVGTANALIHLALHRWAAGQGNGQYIIAGATSGSFVRNNEAYLLEAAENAGLRLSPVGGVLPGYVLDPIGVRLFLFGGGNARSYMPLRGITADAAWIDEATLCDRRFIETAEERLSFSGSQIIVTTNADAPAHWLKADWIDEPGVTEPGRQAWENSLFLLSDFAENTYYPDDRRQHLLGQNPASAHYQRNIGNTWAGVEGLVYPIPPNAIVNESYTPLGYAFIDPATAGRTAALLFVRRPDGGYLVADEYYHDGDKQGRLTDAEHWQRIKARWQLARVFIDPAAAAFRQVVAANDYTPYLANNAWLPGVQATNNALYDGKLTINSRCVNLLACCAALQWNDRGTQSKPGTPDDLPDCLRYGAMHFFPHGYSTLLGR